MSNMKGSAVLFAAVAMMMFLTGCETTKHSEAMSAEQLRALKQASRQGSVTSKDTKQGGGSLDGQSLSEETLRKTQAIFQLREHAWAIAQIRTGNDRDEIIKQRDQSIANVQHLL